MKWCRTSSDKANQVNAIHPVTNMLQKWCVSISIEQKSTVQCDSTEHLLIGIQRQARKVVP